MSNWDLAALEPRVLFAGSGLERVSTAFPRDIVSPSFSSVVVGSKVVYGGFTESRLYVYPWDPPLPVYDDLFTYDVEAGTWTTAKLTVARGGTAAVSVGGLAVFAGGSARGADGEHAYSDVVDVYDPATGELTTARLSQATAWPTAAVVGDVAVFADGSKADVFDAGDGTWTTGTLSEAGSLMAAVVVGDQIVLYGGYDDDGGIRTAVDVYDVGDDTWTSGRLTDLPAGATGGKGAQVVGSRVVFVGGFPLSRTVDVYDSLTGAWSSSPLPASFAYDGGARAVVGSKVLYAGGSVRDDVGQYASADVANIYDAATGEWSEARLSVPRWPQAVVVGDKAVFAGGAVDGPGDKLVSSDAVDVYDGATGTWTTGRMPRGRSWSFTAAAGGKAIFAGGTEEGTGRSATVDVYDPATGRWSTAAPFAVARENSFAAYADVVGGTRVVFAGGAIVPSAGTTIGAVDVYQPDATPPAARVAPAAATASVRERARTFRFTVNLHDPSGIDLSTLGNGDVVVRGPDDFKAAGRFVSARRGKHGSTRVVTYAVRAPEKGWDAGAYTVRLKPGAVADRLGNAVAAGVVGTIDVGVEPAAATGSARAPATSRRADDDDDRRVFD